MGQRIALHAGKGWDERAEQYLPPGMGTEWEPWLIKEEGIVGTAFVAGWVHVDETGIPCGAWWEGADKANLAVYREAVSSPFFFGPYGWILEDVRELVRAVPCRGKQGLWHIPEELLPAVSAAEIRPKHIPFGV
jgi:hypothetical protein